MLITVNLFGTTGPTWPVKSQLFGKVFWTVPAHKNV